MSRLAMVRGIAPHRIQRDDRALLVSVDVLMAAAIGIALLAGAANHPPGDFCRNYISQNAGFFSRAGGTLVGCGDPVGHPVSRASSAFRFSFLEEMWARNSRPT